MVDDIREQLGVRFSVRNARGQNRERQSLLSRYSTDLGQCLSRKRSEQALRAATTEQILANRAKSEFLATMSHELRTPLNAIIGFSELIAMLSTDPTAAKTLEYAGHVNQAGKHLHEIISDILDISKLESGSLELDLEYVPLWDLIEASTALVGPRIKQKRQELVLALPASLPSVFADARRIKQVLINLLANAHKFTPIGKQIFVGAKTQLDQTVAISVRDEGIGMTTDEIVIALKPFGQVRSGRDHTHEGTGLGLPISKAMIEQHGGTFCVTSRKGTGTTVTFTLRVLAIPTTVLPEENLVMSVLASTAPLEVPKPDLSGPVAQIVSVSGAQAVALLDRRSAGQSHAVRIEIGDTVMVPTPHTIVVGLVSGVTVTMPDTDADQNTLRLIEINLAGEIIEDTIHGRPEFRRGVSCLPTLGDSVHLADRQILSLAYGQPDAATVEVGTLFQNSAVPARLLVDELFGKHFLIVGTTGSGKTSALTCILQSLLPEYKQARVVVLDIHNEYAAAFGEQAEVH